MQGSILGNAVLRKEDPSLLFGTDQFYDDMVVDGLCHVHFVRSPFAHAGIESIDLAEARSQPGVIAVHSAQTLELEPFLGFPIWPPAVARPPLAKGKVRFVGDIVAVVVAETRAQAEDAVEAVLVEYEPLPVVTDAEQALLDGAPILFAEHVIDGAPASNQIFETSIGDEDPLADANRVIEARVVSQRLAGVPMETNGCVALPNMNGKLEVWIPSQNPIGVRDALLGQLGLEADALRVAAPTVGGGFGSKAGPYTEFILTAALALELQRPMKWTEGRSENMVAMAHGRDMVLYGKLGLSNDGIITGIDIDVIANAGSYPAIGALLPVFTQSMSQGVYKIPKLRFRARSVMTNTTATAAYRGAGRPEATQLLERIIDIAADELGIDPVEIRRRNFLQPEDFPLTTHGGSNYDVGEYDKALDQALEVAGYSDMLKAQTERRASGSTKQLGIGIASYVEVTAPNGLHIEFGAVEVHEDGTATARVGTSAHGQGHDTAFSMLVSDMLGIPMDKITLVQSDTDHIPRGAGTMGSRSLQTAGSAVHVASKTVLEKAKLLAAHLLEANVSDIEKSVAAGHSGNSGLQVAGVPAKAITWGELASAANDASRRPADMEGGLAHELDFDGQDSTYPFGSHVSLVEVDTETGQIEILRHIAVDDCGKILNPMLVRGQQHGGIAQGVAQALFEQVCYDDDGNPITSNLMDYLIPSATELINFESSNTETPTFRNPLGAKGIGESGTIGSTPALHNAVIDAVSHLGVTHIDMPLTPERIWSAIHRD